MTDKNYDLCIVPGVESDLTISPWWGSFAVRKPSPESLQAFFFRLPKEDDPYLLLATFENKKSAISLASDKTLNKPLRDAYKGVLRKIHGVKPCEIRKELFLFKKESQAAAHPPNPKQRELAKR